ncbi:hypothetical protein ACFGVR_11710 [Mucilaginibacter sp. AW1-3]
MKTTIAILVFVMGIAFSKTYAQSKAKYDTLYYFLDIAHTPVKDRMITTDFEQTRKYYTINCPCLKSGEMPTFRCDTTRRINISGEIYKKTNFISLPALISLSKKYTFDELVNKYVIYFVEAFKNGYVKTEVFLQEYRKDTIIDFDTIKADTLKKTKKH